MGSIQPFTRHALLLYVATACMNTAARQPKSPYLNKVIEALAPLCKKLHLKNFLTTATSSPQPQSLIAKLQPSHKTDDDDVDVDVEAEIITRCKALRNANLLPAHFMEWLDHLPPADEQVYIFRYGPVVEALHSGALLLLEDFDFPDSAVTERLNSLLEPDPVFVLNEDLQHSSAGGRVPVSPSFRVVATIHRDSPEVHASVIINPAVSSRFTEVVAPSYTKEDIKTVVKFAVEEELKKDEEVNIK